jgi:arylsulfatase A-like enzyme
VLFNNAEKYLKSIMDEIKKLKLEDDSLILIMSDHGISVGEKFGERAYGSFCYDYTLRTFTYFLSEEFTSRKISQQIRTIDFMPTILDFLKIPFDNNYEKIDGTSLMPLIHGLSIPEQIAYSETGNPLDKKAPPKEPNTKSIRTSKWKLISNQYDNSRELYNLELDPGEEKNLAGKGEQIESLLWQELQKLEKESN